MQVLTLSTILTDVTYFVRLPLHTTQFLSRVHVAVCWPELSACD
jgi:hypothetical protein